MVYTVTSERRRGVVLTIPRQAEQGGGDSLESLIPLSGRTNAGGIGCVPAELRI